MTLTSLKFLSEVRLAELRGGITANLHRYTHGDFADLAVLNGWAIESTSAKIDIEALARLDGTVRTAEADIENSLTVYRAMPGLTPSLAREERVWTRLTHVECLTYSRTRWLSGQQTADVGKAIQTHMFAPGLTGVRDDNAVSRLWWNMHIAAVADPDDPESALRLMMKRADIRMQFVERSGTAARRPLAKAIVRTMRRDPWITSTEASFRHFMIAVNRFGGGVLFEALPDAQTDHILDKCAQRARVAHQTR